MTLTLELPAPLDQRIRDRAAELGRDPESMVVDLVRDHFSSEAAFPFAALTGEETRWFKQVNEVPPSGVRERWRELDALRRAGQLNDDQQAEMTKLYDQIEANHARRIEAAAELARLWECAIDSVIDQLGLSPTGAHD